MSGRLPTLDGLRAISIGLVLLAHAAGTGGLPMNPRISHVMADAGVRTFFVLSGFLITTLLLRERAREGSISLRDFYIRRAARIFPAFYTYLAVVALLGTLGLVAVTTGDLVRGATYTMNFTEERSWVVGHLWSLAVEEQFYLLWPFALVVLGFAGARGVAIGAILLAPLVRLGLWIFVPEHRALTDQAFPCVFDSLATGCAIALWREPLTAWLERRGLFDVRIAWLVPVVAIGALFVTNPFVHYGASMTLANLGIAFVLLYMLSHADGRVGRILETRGFVWVGGLSYSLYLWQQPFLNRHADGWWNTFPVNLVLAFAAACACHYLVEKPILAFNFGRNRRRQLPVAIAAASTSLQRT